MTFRAGVDTGGTFTDLVALDEETGEIRMTKVLSTPSRPSQAVFDSFQKAGLDTNDISYFVHGTTIGVNAIIQRTGAPIALLVTEGFRDVLEMARLGLVRLHQTKAGSVLLYRTAKELDIEALEGIHG